MMATPSSSVMKSTVFALLACLFASTLHAQTTWTLTSSGLPGVAAIYSIAYGNGRFVAAINGGSRSAMVSTDGLVWRFTGGTITGIGSCVLFKNGFFTLLNNTGLYRSADGDTWTKLNANASNTTSTRAPGAATGTAYLFAIDQKTLLYSADGSAWVTGSPLPSSNASVFIKSIAAFADRFYVSYYNNSDESQKSYAAWTTDGVSWNPINLANSGPFLEFFAGNGQILAYYASPTSGASTTASSTDGVNFSVQNTDPTKFFANAPVAFTGGRFIRFSASLTPASIQTSTDGANFTSFSALTGNGTSWVNDIAFGAGRYIAGGFRLSSPNGEFIATISAAASPVLNTSPAPRSLIEGSAASFTVTLENPDTATTYQWKRDGVALAGATAPTFSLAQATPADAGRYTCTITNAFGSVTSDAALLTVLPVAKAGRIINLSVLTSLDAPDTDFTLGFVLGGAGTSGAKSLLVRAAGPSLAPFGITNFLPDPKLRFFANGTLAGENNDWLGTAPLTALIAQTGAFTYAGPTSKDAAFAPANLTTASNTVVVSSATAGAGIGSVIAEVYDATPNSAFTPTTPRLINVSVLKNIPAGGTLTAGFVIGGITAKTVLIRATGPALAALGVPGTLADPRLTFYQTGTAVALATNDNWSGTQTLKDAFIAVGAFPLDPTSKDAALLLTLQPGSYTAQASGVGSSAGTALVEIYEIP